MSISEFRKWVDLCIAELVLEHDCVIIPNLGAFVCDYQPASISVANHKISPPSKVIVFTDRLKVNDGLLFGKLASKLGLEAADLSKLFLEYLESLIEELFQYKHYDFDTLGKLYINDQGHMVFEQLQKSNYLKDSYGLPDLYYRPIDRSPASPPSQFKIYDHKRMEDLDNTTTDESLQDEEFEYVEESSTKKSSGMMGYYALLGFVLVLTLGTTYYLNMDKETYAVGSFSPMSWFGSSGSSDVDLSKNKLLPDEQPADNVEQVESSETSAEDAIQTPAYATTKSTESFAIDPAILVTESKGVYYVVAGSFKKSSKAAKYQRELASNGLDSKIIQSGDGMYRVTLADFTSYDEASARKSELSASYGEEIWVYNF